MKRFPCEKQNMISIVAGVFSGVGCILMVLFPRLALSAADRGLSLFVKSVLPSLLPFFICANFMIALGVPAVLGRFFDRLFRSLFHAPGKSAFVFIISITSGYPMGAKLIGEMGRRGDISVTDGKRMLSFCTTSGPLFMLGTVGSGMLACGSAGAVIALSHYTAAIVNGLLFRVLLDVGTRRSETGGRSRAENAEAHTNTPEKRRSGILELFTSSILSAFQSLGIICGYIVLFTLLTDFLEFSGILSFAADWQRGIGKGILEMTVGAQTIAASGEISLRLKCALCSMLISFGGLSITAQSISMLSGFPVGIGYYFKTKLSHAIIAFFSALILSSKLLPSAAETGSFLKTPGTAFGSAYSTFFSLKMMALVLAMFFLICAMQNAADRFRTMRIRRRLASQTRQEQKKNRKQTKEQIKKDKKNESTRNHSRI